MSVQVRLQLQSDRPPELSRYRRWGEYFNDCRSDSRLKQIMRCHCTTYSMFFYIGFSERKSRSKDQSSVCTCWRWGESPAELQASMSSLLAIRHQAGASPFRFAPRCVGLGRDRSIESGPPASLPRCNGSAYHPRSGMRDTLRSRGSQPS